MLISKIDEANIEDKCEYSQHMSCLNRRHNLYKGKAPSKNVMSPVKCAFVEKCQKKI